MKVYLDNPVTDLERLILMTMRAKPKVCRVPEKVNKTENCLSLTPKKRMRIMTARPIQYLKSLPLWLFIKLKIYVYQINVPLALFILVLKYKLLCCPNLTKPGQN